MKSIYYTFLKEDQIREFVSDALSSMGCMSCLKLQGLSIDWEFERDEKGLNIECISLINAYWEDLKQIDTENKGINDLLISLKEQKVNFIYYNVGENSIKAYIIKEFSKWKRTEKISKLPFVNIKFYGSINKNLHCLITASKTEISAEIEQKIFDTKQEHVENIDDLKVKKYKYIKERRN